MGSRLDIKQYYQAVSVGTNVQFLPQGGVRRRPGFKYIDEPVGGDGRLIAFEFNTDQKYLLLFTNNKIEIYRTDTDLLVDTVTSTYATADIFDIDFAQTADTMILVHEDYAPRILERGATDSAFTLSTISFDEIPQHDFDDSSSPTPVSEIQRITFSNYTAGDRYKFHLEGILSDELVWGSGTAHEEMAMELQELPNTGNTGISVAYVSAGVWDITFAGASAKDWTEVGATGTSTNNSGFKSNTSTTQDGTARTEDVWSATRGWPRTVTFFQGRLWFGGSGSRPHTIWGSRVNNFYNFDPGKSRADQAINITLDTDQINRIQALVGGRSLSVFTIGGEHVFKSSATEGITPENVSIIPQTFSGSKRITPVSLGGVQIFIQRTGKAIREFVFNFDEEAYDSSSLTLLSPDIISDPVDIQVQRGTTADDATYAYLTNDDGTLAAFCSARSENVAAWSKWETDGSFKSCAVVLDELYVLVERTIDGVTRHYIEKQDNDSYTDSAKHYAATAGASLTSLNHLDGEEVRVVIDDYVVLPNETVPSSSPWTITLPYSAETAEVGLNFNTAITTMPISQDPGNGFDFNNKIRVSRATLDLYESLGVKVNGNTLPDVRAADGSLSAYTGQKSAPLMGWKLRPTVSITQTDPLPMTILGINLEVNG